MTEPTRKIARQATSAVAHIAPEPEEDDPLLAFAPFIHAAPRRNSITPDLQRRFVGTLAATGIVTQAARSIGKSMEALYKLRARPGAEGFAAAWDAALERGVQRLEDCALERALEGTPTPIVSSGKLLGVWHKPDNGLLRFLLQHRLRDRYSPASSSEAVGPKKGDAVYEAIRAEVLAEERAKVAARSPEAINAARRERAIALYGYDPEEGEPPEEDAGDGAIDWDAAFPGEEP
ncbi:hypothetical protein [Qipengyuania gaetbuli]|uniref:hypothetical protein n=1 Tax=Qipengyuania gaetbuli TaxID=266952 RepID=UPI001CD7083E|nr:hypothetical protein [Qipengyuania gaetbuli]MCA0909043.1 hypothetical protein [Qipengyuania gaetbuli]